MLSFEQWERVRPVLRPLFIREKERRRFVAGPHLTLLFENAQTVWYQVEEMIRIERIAEPQAVQHELDTYNSLIPVARELSATLLIEYAEARERDAALARLVGLERHMWLAAGGRRIAVRFDESQMSAGQISAVQFVRFALGQLGAESLVQFADQGSLAIEADHPDLTTRAPLSGELARALAEDLRIEP